MQRTTVSVTAAPEPGANPRYDGYYPQCRALWQVLNRLQWVGQIYNASLNAHTHAHTMTDTSCQGGFLDWAVLPVGLADWQSRPARPIRSREREPPFFLPFTKRMTHKERAVKCRK